MKGSWTCLQAMVWICSFSERLNLTFTSTTYLHLAHDFTPERWETKARWQIGQLSLFVVLEICSKPSFIPPLPTFSYHQFPQKLALGAKSWSRPKDHSTGTKTFIACDVDPNCPASTTAEPGPSHFATRGETLKVTTRRMPLSHDSAGEDIPDHKSFEIWRTGTRSVIMPKELVSWEIFQRNRDLKGQGISMYQHREPDGGEGREGKEQTSCRWLHGELSFFLLQCPLCTAHEPATKKNAHLSSGGFCARIASTFQELSSSWASIPIPF